MKCKKIIKDKRDLATVQARDKKGRLTNQTATFCIDCEEQYFNWEMRWLINRKLLEPDDPKLKEGAERWKNKLVSGQAGKVTKFEFEHTDIPWKDEEWLEGQRERRSDAELEREVFKSYAGTLEGKVYAAEWQLYVKENHIDYDPKLPLFCAWDFGLDTTAILWLQKDMTTDKVRVIDAYQNSGKPIDFYVPFVTGDVVSGLFEYDEDDIMKMRLHKEWKRDITHYGDPDVKKTSYQTGKSTKDILMEHGIHIQHANTTKKSHQILRETTRMLLRRLEVNAVRCEEFIDALISARYPERMEASQTTTPITKPIHDYTSHYRTSLEYFADNEPSHKDRQNVPQAPIGYSYHPNSSKVRNK